MVALVVAAIIFIPKAICDSKYERALEYGEEGNYEEAIEILEGLDEEEYNTEWYIRGYTYALGVEKMEAGDYEAALEFFSKTENYKRTYEYSRDCNNAIQKEKELQTAYETAMRHKEDGKYEEAIAASQKWINGQAIGGGDISLNGTVYKPVNGIITLPGLYEKIL